MKHHELLGLDPRTFRLSLVLNSRYPNGRCER